MPIADLTMPPAPLDLPVDPDEQKRRAQQLVAIPPAPIPSAQPATAAPSAPAMPPATVTPLTGRDRDLAISATNQPAMPPANAAPAPEAPSVGGPMMPPATIQTANPQPPMPNGPQMEAYNQLSAQGAPKLSGWRKALDVIGSMFPLGRGIETSIPGTPQNYDARLTNAAMRAAREQKLTGGERQLQEEPEDRDLNRRNVESEITARGAKDSQALAAHGLKRDENGQVVADEDSPIYKANQQKLSAAETLQANVQKYRESQIALNKARTEVEKAKNDPNSPAYKAAQQKLEMAERAHAIAQQNLGLHQQEFQNKLHEQELVKPSGQTVSRGDAAGAALKLLPQIQRDVREHAKDFGPIIGRIAKGEIALGNVDPEVQRVYAELQSFYSLQPAVHGFRNAEFVKDFNAFVGNLQTNPDAVIAGLNGLKPTLTEVEKSGRTYKPRIVEDAGPKPPEGKSTVYDPQGAPHFVDSSKLDKFLKDPKYKGWSKNAPAG